MRLFWETMVHLIGTDYFGQRHLAALRQALGDETVAAMNTTVFEGPRLDVAALRTVCDTLPFLSPRRLVIVRRLFAWLGQSGEGREASAARREVEQALLAYLPQLPATTDLVFQEEELPRAGALLAYIEAHGTVVAPRTLRGEELTDWIAHRLAEEGCRASPEAVQLLATYAGEDLAALDREIVKVATYAAGQTLTAEAVRRLVPDARQADIFDLVDALGRRDRVTALRALRQLLQEGEPPAYILVMLGRQLRLLLQARELYDQGRREREIAGALHLPRFVAEKLTRQAAHFRREPLLRLLRALVALDAALKSGQIDGALGLELFLLEALSGPTGARSTAAGG